MNLTTPRSVLHSLSMAALGLAGACGLPTAALGTITITTDPTVIADFQNGATIETFDDLAAFAIVSYSAGQNIDAGAKFSSRDGNTKPTFHSGGASPNDPVGNPGTPIGIVDPEGGIANDFQSPDNVAAPLVINSDELFNFGFMEIIFPDEVQRVGFWITHGTVTLFMRDNTGSNLATGDVMLTASAGQFVGISRDAADVKVAAMSGGESFTIDDVTYATQASSAPGTVPEASSVWGASVLGAGVAAFGFRQWRRGRRNEG